MAIQFGAYGFPTYFAAPNPLSGAWGYGAGLDLGLPYGATVGALYLPRSATYLKAIASSKQLQIPIYLRLGLGPQVSAVMGGFFETMTKEPLNYGVIGGLRANFGKFYQETRLNYGLVNYKSKDFLFIFGFQFSIFSGGPKLCAGMVADC